ncbi:probable methyltransferase TARBP1 isoform X2 [Ambystoma mexicanum]|uniref:probable methyltransferase TARBP1 isoform X2 n=1 Tax=Ambystoma mexicanum TaxID=8296 RepID=UPI0037E778D4
MELMLADMLLLHCRDPGVLLGQLVNWADTGPLPTDLAVKLDTLRFVLQRISERRLVSEEVLDVLPAAVRKLALERCLPLLAKLTVPGPAASEGLRQVRALSGVIRHCAELCGPDLAAHVASVMLNTMELYEGLDCEQFPGTDGFSGAGPLIVVAGAIEVLWAVLPSLLDVRERQFTSPLVDRLLRIVLAEIRGGPEEAAALLAGRLVPVLATDELALQQLWAGAYLAEDGTWTAPRRMLLLSCLCEYVMPEGGSARTQWPSLCRGFWEAVQEGLICTDNLSRKRALYLLRRALRCNGCSSESEVPLGLQGTVYVASIIYKKQGETLVKLKDSPLFWWSPEKNEELLRFWENYILIMETLEGNQMHVVKPVLPKLKYLMELAALKEKGCWLFHPSWHLCIYKRMLQSDNKTLVREGVFNFLDLCETSTLPGLPEFCDFIMGPLLDAISESSLFSRSPGQLIGACPHLGMKFENFLTKFISCLPEQNKGSFLLRFIQKVTSRHWCAVPLLFITKALAHIPASKSWGRDGLLALRKVLQCTMSTHEILLRGAAQCFLLQAAMNLMDVEKVSHGEIARFLMALTPEESLCRGTTLWKQVCDWLYTNDNYFRSSFICDTCQDKTLLNIYVKGLVEDYLQASPSDGEINLVPDLFDAKLVATMILLALDVNEQDSKVTAGRNIECKELTCLLYPLLDSLMKLSTNPYLPTRKTDRSLQLLDMLLQRTLKSSTFNKGGLPLCLMDSILPAVPNILEFLLRRLTCELRTVPDLDRCNLYLAALSELVNLSSKIDWKTGTSLQNFIFSLSNASVQTFQKAIAKQKITLGKQIQKVVSMACLAWACEMASRAERMQIESRDVTKLLSGFVSSTPLNQALKKPEHIEVNAVLDELSSQGWGKITARYLHDQWVCVLFTLHKHQDLIASSEDMMTGEPFSVFQRPLSTLKNALEALIVLPPDQVLPVIHCIKILVKKLLKSTESLCIQSMKAVWKVVSLCNTQITFWPNLKAFVQFVFDPDILALAARDKSDAFFTIKDIICELIDMSNTKTGVFNVAMSYCCHSWIALPTGDLSYSQNPQNYIELMTEACIFGPVFRRDQRLIQDTIAFIQNLGDECAANSATESATKDDCFVRVCAIKFLCWLDGSNESHRTFMEHLVVKLLDKDELVSKTKIRYYGNSLQHRVKNRLWQTLLVLFPKLEQIFINKIIGRVFKAAFSNNQASVKYLIEWLLILILHKFPQILSHFWDCFCCTEEMHKTSICTFLAVLTHFDMIIQSTSERKLLLKKALIVALQWCFNHNFSVRLYALIALKKLWTMTKDLSVNDFEALADVIESSLHQVETMQGVGNAKKNWQRIQEHFFFSTFHPLEDYSIETIFWTLPSLSEIVEEEWIPACSFSRSQDIPLDSKFIKLYNSRPVPHGPNPSGWSQQDIGSTLAEVDAKPEGSDVQKKIIPWKNRIVGLDLGIVIQERAAKLGKSNGSLIVVASLIDKPTNLGGLCRTSEIFGASSLVVDSLHYVNDKQFQYLSVSSEQWLPLVEVKPSQLVDYLQQKKTEGYAIIGVEQTAKSFALQEFVFPEKSLLLLGNEREGIPANLIQHLDVCVEIPQVGIVRSLNVHVSGALMIWEYTKQQIMKHKALK